MRLAILSEITPRITNANSIKIEIIFYSRKN